MLPKSEKDGVNQPLHAVKKSALGPVAADPKQFISPLIAEAFADWHTLKAAQAYPLLRALTSKSPPGYWSHASVADRIEGGFLVRFQGPQSVQTYGDLSDRYVSEFPSPLRERVSGLLEVSVSEGMPIYAFWPRSAARGQPFIGVEVLSLPWSKTGADLDHITMISVNAYGAATV